MTPDVVIAGGGPAGASAAAWLAQADAKVLVLEKSTGPHQKVCGEFVSGEAGDLMRTLSLDMTRLGAVPIERMRLCGPGGVADAALPFPAWSLGRDVIDEALLRTAADQGATIRRGATVSGIERDGSGFTVRIGEERLLGSTVVLATGKHSLRNFPRKARGEPMLGLKQYWRLSSSQARELDGHVEVHLFPGGYLGLQPAATGAANLCLAVYPSYYRRLGTDFGALLAHAKRHSPALRDRMDGAEPAWPKPIAIANIPYGFVHKGAEAGRLHRVGDQLAVIPSFCGDGMAIALASAKLATQHIQGTGEALVTNPFRSQVALAQAIAWLTAQPLPSGFAVALARLFPAALVWLAAQTRVRLAPSPQDA